MSNVPENPSGSAPENPPQVGAARRPFKEARYSVGRTQVTGTIWCVVLAGLVLGFLSVLGRYWPNLNLIWALTQRTGTLSIIGLVACLVLFHWGRVSAGWIAATTLAFVCIGVVAVAAPAGHRIGSPLPAQSGPYRVELTAHPEGLDGAVSVDIIEDGLLGRHWQAACTSSDDPAQAIESAVPTTAGTVLVTFATGRQIELKVDPGTGSPKSEPNLNRC